MDPKSKVVVTARYETTAKIAPQLEEILRGVPRGFPCTYLEKGDAEPIPQPAGVSDAGERPERESKPEPGGEAERKDGLMARVARKVTGKGKKRGTAD